jgi:hypothetical protein
VASPSESSGQYLVLADGLPISTTSDKNNATPLILSPINYSLGSDETLSGNALTTLSGSYINVGPTTTGNVINANQNTVMYKGKYMFNSDPENATLILNSNNAVQAFFSNAYWYILYLKNGLSGSILNSPGLSGSSVDPSNQYYQATFQVVN